MVDLEWLFRTSEVDGSTSLFLFAGAWDLFLTGSLNPLVCVFALLELEGERSVLVLTVFLNLSKSIKSLSGFSEFFAAAISLLLPPKVLALFLQPKLCVLDSSGLLSAL